MARSKGGKPTGNKYARMIKNYEMIGQGKKETVKEILKRGPQTPQKTVQEIKAKKEQPHKDK